MEALRWQYPARAEPLEPSLTTPQKLDWLMETQVPVRRPRAPAPVPTTFVVEPILVVSVTMDQWYRQPSEPVWEFKRPTQQGQPVHVTEPSLFVSQDLSWLVQHPGPQPIPRPVDVGHWTGVLDPSLFVEVVYVLANTIFLYEAAKYVGFSFYFEASLLATAGTAYAQLYNRTDSAAVAGSTVSTGSATLVRQRSGEIALEDGKEYQARFGAVAGDDGEGWGAQIVPF